MSVRDFIGKLTYLPMDDEIKVRLVLGDEHQDLEICEAIRKTGEEGGPYCVIEVLTPAFKVEFA